MEKTKQLERVKWIKQDILGRINSGDYTPLDYDWLEIFEQLEGELSKPFPLLENREEDM